MEQGDVVKGPDFIGGSKWRPYIVISNQKHPFSGEEFLAVLITTTEREEAVKLSEEDFLEGGLPKESFASPWTVTTLKENVVDERMGKLESGKIQEITEKVRNYIKVSDVE
jgi:mRNA-degrading endonuclease toxin of MazEF toxin-antitoxin module